MPTRPRTPAGAALVLIVSLAAYAGTSMVAVQPFQMIDLGVYVGATAHPRLGARLASDVGSFVVGLQITFPGVFTAVAGEQVAWLQAVYTAQTWASSR